MATTPTAIHHYDVVIIGGGIAGIAIAELLSRKTELRIKVIDHAPQLGTGASGKLEGWFHSGALYAGNDDAQTFLNCVNAIEDLVNLYSSHFGPTCNMVLAESRPSLFVPSVERRPGAWFNDARTFFVLPGQGAPDITLSRFKNDAFLWSGQRQRMLNRLEAAFGLQHNWRMDGRCGAPSYADIENCRGSACSLEVDSAALAELCARHDETFGVSASAYSFVESLDVSMNTTRIMRDLVASAIASGVDFETGLTIENLVVERFGPARVRSVLCRDRQGVMNRFKARLFIFAIGSGFTQLLDQLNLRVRIKTHKSAMVVAAPPMCAINFARMSIRDRFHFNHFVQQAGNDEDPVRYSMLASSSFAQDNADVEQDVSEIDHLLESAERYFGKSELYSRRLYSYDCLKTEFVSEDEEKRRYSYWIEVNGQTNYICVLPGKFSFFPTVAYQTYLRVKQLLDVPDAERSGTYVPDRRVEALAREFVADSYPAKILAEERLKESRAEKRVDRPTPRSRGAELSKTVPLVTRMRT